MNRLAEIRKQRGLTLRELSRMTGIAFSYINMLERGKRGDFISLTHARRLAGALGVSTSDIWPSETTDAADPYLGPLGVLTVEERIRMARVLLTGTGYGVERESSAVMLAAPSCPAPEPMAPEFKRDLDDINQRLAAIDLNAPDATMRLDEIDADLRAMTA